MPETRSLVSGYTTSNSKCAPNHAQRVCAEHRGAKTTDEQTQPNKHNRCDYVVCMNSAFCQLKENHHRRLSVGTSV